MNCRLRAARPSDSGALLRWRNDSRVYRHYLTPRRVSRAEHERWLAARLTDRHCRLYILEAGSKAAGQVRLDLSGRAAEVSLCVDPALQGRGLGRRALELAAAKARRLGLRKLLAVTLPENVPSTIAFLKAGYGFERRARAAGRPVYRLSLPL